MWHARQNSCGSWYLHTSHSSISFSSLYLNLSVYLHLFAYFQVAPPLPPTVPQTHDILPQKRKQDYHMNDRVLSNLNVQLFIFYFENFIIIKLSTYRWVIFFLQSPRLRVCLPPGRYRREGTVQRWRRFAVCSMYCIHSIHYRLLAKSCLQLRTVLCSVRYKTVKD